MQIINELFEIAQKVSLEIGNGSGACALKALTGCQNTRDMVHSEKNKKLLRAMKETDQCTVWKVNDAAFENCNRFRELGDTPSERIQNMLILADAGLWKKARYGT